MPCGDPWDPETNLRRANQLNQELTVMLCEALRLLEGRTRSGTIDAIATVKLRQWWAKHKAEDEAREKKEKHEAHLEKVKKRVLSKLTAEEKEAFGIKE